jgi:hypothetical protein
LIKYNYEVSVNENRAKLNKDIFLFRGNRNIHYYFSIKGARFAFEKEGDLIENANAIYAAVTVIKPNGVEVANAIAPVENGLIHLKVTEDLIDEEVEIGDFDLVFDLFDDSDGAVTIPKIKGQFHVQERPCTTSIGTLSGNVNVVNQAVVDLAIATQENEQLIVVDDDGKYVKTTWAKGNKISVERLNKMEEGIYNNSSQLKDIANKMVGVGTKLPTGDNRPLYFIKVEEKKYYTVTNSLTYCVSSNENTNVEENSNYIATLTADSGYVLGIPVITMGGTDITSQVYSNGTINIPYVTGDIVITCTATEQTVATYSITNNLINCTNSNSVTSIEENSSYVATISANESYTLGDITVTMGGTDISSTVVSGSSINISSVTGNITITCKAIKQTTSITLKSNYADNYNSTEDFDIFNAKTITFTNNTDSATITYFDVFFDTEQYGRINRTISSLNISPGDSYVLTVSTISSITLATGKGCIKMSGTERPFTIVVSY